MPNLSASSACYPHYRDYTSVADPWWPGTGGRCSYGSTRYAGSAVTDVRFGS
jgi:hypothetical protein